MQSDDDHIVVMASGDEMILKFALPDRPLPDGWTRDYVLHSVGWDKDADLNTLEGQSSLPLPFASMKAYPPPIEDELRAEAVIKSKCRRWCRERCIPSSGGAARPLSRVLKPCAFCG